ncbi:MAG: cytochrome c [Verrucomicrobiae bacterium]|nr:cytochrome c [Verrucomicrobiae bacterium]MCP5521369.1 cytochrome c [Verrucomicrobiales bacterium]
MKHIAVIAAAALCGGFATLNAAELDAAALAKAKATYEKECAKCHGKEGKGDTKMGQKLECKDYSKAEVWAKFKDEEALKALKEGLKKDGKTQMKAFGDKLKDQEIKDLIAFMKKFKKD